MLAERLETHHGLLPEVGQLELKRYSDSLELLHERPYIDEDALDIEIQDRHLILIDDVLYTGETMFRAACSLRAGGATFIQTAFLCARPGLKMPLHADFVGARFDILQDWVIHCAIPPYEDHLGIVLAHQDAVRKTSNENEEDPLLDEIHSMLDCLRVVCAIRVMDDTTILAAAAEDG